MILNGSNKYVQLESQAFLNTKWFDVFKRYITESAKTQLTMVTARKKLFIEK